jgi:hypothetical protein
MKRSIAMAAILATTAVGACASSEDQSLGGPLPAGSGGNDADTQLAEAGDAPPSFGEASTSGCNCSADLHQVICNGVVAQTCPADQGCAAGACVQACAAAQANQSSVGCDYFTYTPNAYGSFPVPPDNCFAAYIANTWGSPVTITVDFAGTPLPNLSAYGRVPAGSGQAITYAPLSNNQLPPGQVAILFLADTLPPPSGNVSCPPGVQAAYSMGNSATHGTGIGRAFHISTDRPVVAYDIYPYGGGISAITSATLLLPTTAWDTNYVAVDAYDTNAIPFNVWISVVAQADNTNVTISPTSAILGGPGVAPTGLGQPHTYTMNRGQVLQFAQMSELNGSPIQADKPVGVFGGTQCMHVPDAFSACDSGHQQLFPVRTLGHEYVYTRYRDRYKGVPESPPVRIIGAVDGTTLTYDPSPPATAPTTLASKQMVEFDSATPFVVKSQDDKHPFYVVAYMTGCDEYAGAHQGNDCRGDPEFVNIVPPQEYLTQYTFFTDPTYPETELVVVRQQNQRGVFDDVTLDCLGPTPVSSWQPVGTSGKYQYARVDLVTGNFQKVGNCDNGRHQMTSNTPFGLTVWGWGSGATGGALSGSSVPGFYSQYVSYAYPAGMSVQPITSVVISPQ